MDTLARLAEYLWSWRFFTGLLTGMLGFGLCALAYVETAFALKRAPEQIGRSRPMLPVMDSAHRWWKQLVDWLLYWTLAGANLMTLYWLVDVYTYGSSRWGMMPLAFIVGMVVLLACAVAPLVQCLSTYVGLAIACLWHREELLVMQEFWNDFWDLESGSV